MATLKATERKDTGTRKAKKLRQQSIVPGVVYGHGAENIPVSLDQHDLSLAIAHGEILLEIDIKGKMENVLLKEIQYDVFGRDILHVDLCRVRLDEKVELTVSINLRGTPAGVADGGVLNQVSGEVRMSCQVRNIPDEIRHFITEMQVDDRIVFADLVLPEGAELLEDPHGLVCTLAVVAEQAEEAVDEDGDSAEPEVIREKPAEDDEDSEGEKK